jgi:spore coat protein CotH
MRPCRLLPAAFLLALGFLLAGPSAAQAQRVEDPFDPGALHEVRVFINSRELPLLRERFDLNTYYPADFQWQSIRVRSVAVRSRGVASRSGTKLGLEVDFDYYTKGQQFFGLDSLVLDNLTQDPAMVRERIAMSFFARMGLPAPRTSFARLYINNVFQGVYSIVEPVEQPLLERSFVNADGHLFEYHWLWPFYAEDLGPDLSAYRPLFEPRTRRLEPDAALYGPIADLFREVNGGDEVTWRARVDGYLDLEAFVRHVAVENFLAEPDGLLGYAGMTNFYLYRPIGTTRHRLIPWDKDLALSQIDYPILARAGENAIFRRAMSYSDLRDLYLQVLEECVQASVEDGWLAGEVERAAFLITPAAYEDALKPYSNADFDAAIRFVQEFAARRAAFVWEEVARLRRALQPQ